MTLSPLQSLVRALFERDANDLARGEPGDHLSPGPEEGRTATAGPERMIEIGGRRLFHFGSTSFLGLDEDSRIRAAVVDAVRQGGTQGAREIDRGRAAPRLAAWLGSEAAILFPSVPLIHLAVIPALVSAPDLLVVAETACGAIQEAGKIAEANAVRVVPWTTADSKDLERVLSHHGSYRGAVVVVPGLDDSGGAVPLDELSAVCKKRNAVLYVDDTEATGIVGPRGRGTVAEGLVGMEEVLVAGSLSGVFAAQGGFLACTREMKGLLSERLADLLHGDALPGPYQEAIIRVCEILDSDEYEFLRARLRHHLLHVERGLREIGAVVHTGKLPVVSVQTGSDTQTEAARAFLDHRGFLVPAASGALGIHVNVNHRWESINALLDAIADLHQLHGLPSGQGREGRVARAA